MDDSTRSGKTRDSSIGERSKEMIRTTPGNAVTYLFQSIILQQSQHKYVGFTMRSVCMFCYFHKQFVHILCQEFCSLWQRLLHFSFLIKAFPERGEEAPSLRHIPDTSPLPGKPTASTVITSVRSRAEADPVHGANWRPESCVVRKDKVNLSCQNQSSAEHGREDFDCDVT